MTTGFRRARRRRLATCGAAAVVTKARLMLSMTLWLLAVLVPLQILLGDLHGLNTLQHQPAKLAAIEARWDTASRVPLTLFAIPDEKAATNRFAIEMPLLGSLILTHDLDGEVRGLKDWPRRRAAAGRHRRSSPSASWSASGS